MSGAGAGAGDGGGQTPKAVADPPPPPPPPPLAGPQRPPAGAPKQQPSSAGGGVEGSSSSGGGTAPIPAHIAFRIHSDASTTNSSAMRPGLPPSFEELLTRSFLSDASKGSSTNPRTPASAGGPEVRWASDLLAGTVAAQAAGGGSNGVGVSSSDAVSALSPSPYGAPPRIKAAGREESHASVDSSATVRRPGMASVLPGQSWRSLQSLEGDYSSLAAMPPEREDAGSTPWIRWADYTNFFHRVFCPADVGKALRTAVWKPLAGFLWFVSLIWREILFGFVVAAVALHVDGRISEIERRHTPGTDELREYKDTHRLLGAILGFVIGFRVNNAYQLYYEGRRIVGQLINSTREIVLEAYTSLPKGTPGPSFPDDGGVVPGGPAKVDEAVLAEEERYLKMTAREIRRLCMLALAFIRQDVRESHCGFLKGTEMEGVGYSRDTFYMDPVRPRLWDLLSDEELLMYHALHPRARPAVCVGEIKKHVELMCLRLEKGESVFVRVVTPQLVNLLAAHEAMIRIRDTPMPFPVLYVLHISTFVFVYSAPFLYHTDPVGCFVCVQLLTVVYYGLLSISLMIENPFRYASGGFSLPLEKFAKQIHNDTLQIARLLGGDDTTFIPAHLEPPPHDVLHGRVALDAQASSVLSSKRKRH